MKEHTLATAVPPSVVAVLFAQPEIRSLFAALLRMRGVDVEVVNSAELIEEDRSVVTEPQFLHLLTPRQRGSCLIVENYSDSENQEGLRLSRPLTEEKIERALSSFLLEVSPSLHRP